jgi:mono/diheme cytochrome c family protein
VSLGRAALLTGLLGAAVQGIAADAPAYPDGAKTFQTTCAVCHGPAGAGIPSLAPPLVSYPAHYAGSVEGRRQLAMTVLNGLYGDITVGDKHFDFRMPEFSSLDDATLAAVLNFVVFDLAHAPADTKPLTAAEILAERSHPVDGAVVREHRSSVVPAGG